MDSGKSEQGAGWIFAYFREVHGGTVLEESLHYAISHDGLHFTALNDNRPVWRARIDGQPISLRDPFIARGLDGEYHLLATHALPSRQLPDGRYERLDTGLPPHTGPTDLLHARSPDLVTWHDVRLVPILQSLPDAKNLWAPEFVADPSTADHLVIWSTSTGAKMWWDKAIWCARTRDFLAFSAPQVLFDPKLNIIDAHIVPHQGRWYLFYKPDSSDDTKHIHIAVSSHLEGPYQDLVTGITPTITEGPHVVRREDLGEWWLYYDHPWEKRYGLSRSRDFQGWTTSDEAQFPEDARHASVLEVSAAELARLSAAFGTDPGGAESA